MIGTIRKHSKWLWVVIAGITIFSFLYFMGSGPARYGNGQQTTGYGSINGKKVSAGAYARARNDVFLFRLFNYGVWPDRDPNFSQETLQRQIYARLMLVQKARDFGIYIGADAVATAADNILHSPELIRALRVNAASVPLDVFVKQVLQPEGLTAADFENFVRNDLAVEQLQQAIGLTGQLITPQEAAAVYRRENQELSAQIVFFSASNYLSQIAVAPAAVAQFYTNYLAAYRLPDRVQVSYVAFEATNFFAQAKAQWAKTNFDEIVEENYRQLGPDYFRDAKTPAEAKDKIREIMIQQRALAAARDQANEFANAVFNLQPVKPENLATIAKQKGLTARVTAPFDAQYGPEEFIAPENFTKTAFGLSPDEPFSSPIVGRDAVYVIALAKQLPSEIPPFDQIRARVTQDFQTHEATLLAQRAGTNFVPTLTNALAAGKSFSSICLAAGLKPESLPSFSLVTQELPELGDRAELNQLKQAAFTTAVGKPSGFEETETGGFIVYVQSSLPIDETKLNSDLPQFAAALRRSRQNEIFNQWLLNEANRSLRDTPLFHQQADDNAAPAQ